ncbi:hypothetical protein [Paenibacillus foliorum]|nr:hypothetical protein [Paenibacillus foliorum]
MGPLFGLLLGLSWVGLGRAACVGAAPLGFTLGLLLGLGCVWDSGRC